MEVENTEMELVGTFVDRNRQGYALARVKGKYYEIQGGTSHSKILEELHVNFKELEPMNNYYYRLEQIWEDKMVCYFYKKDEEIWLEEKRKSLQGSAFVKVIQLMD